MSANNGDKKSQQQQQSDDELRNASRTAYQERRIREAMLIQSNIARQDARSLQIQVKSSDSNGDGGTASLLPAPTSSSPATTQAALAQQLSSLVFGGKQPAAAQSARQDDSFVAPPHLHGDTVDEGLHSSSNSILSNRFRGITAISSATKTMTLGQITAAATQDPRTLQQQIQQQKAAQLRAEKEEIQAKRRALPVYARREEILEAVRTHQVVVLTSGTGSGKTTQIPQFLLDEGGYKKVVCTQPRVLAATSVAERVAYEMGTRCGDRVGYKVRFDQKAGKNTSLFFVTDGMLLKECMSDPLLSEYDVVMIDEAHERSVNTDILLGLLRDVIRARPELRVLVASATMESERFVNFFGGGGEGSGENNDDNQDGKLHVVGSTTDDGGDSAEEEKKKKGKEQRLNPVCRFVIEGRQFKIKTMFTAEPPDNFVEAAAQETFNTHLHRDFPGDILVFLTGQDDIKKCEARLIEMNRAASASQVRELLILPLYSALPMEDQQKIYIPAPPGTRKVILATNVAETSITIDGIVYVIDCGLVKQKYFDARAGAEALAVVPISKAAAMQRKGRAGRTQAGVCIRLYTKQMFETELETEPTPEILRSSLSSVVLTLKSLGVDNFARFDFVDPPSPDSLAEALKTLLLLGAIASSGELSVTGRRMAELPLEPCHSKMLLTAQNEYGCGKQAAAAVAILSLQNNSMFYIPKDKENDAASVHAPFFRGTCGDITGYVKLFESFEKERYSQNWAVSHFLNYVSARRVSEIRNQLVNTLVSNSTTNSLTSATASSATSDGKSSGSSSNLVTSNSSDKMDELLTRSFLAGFFMNAAVLTMDRFTYRTISKGSNNNNNNTSNNNNNDPASGSMIHPTSCFFSVLNPSRKKQQQQQQQSFDPDSAQNRALFRNVDPETGKPELVVFAEMRCTKDRSFLAHVAAVPREWLLEAAPPRFFKEGALGNAQQQSIAARQRALQMSGAAAEVESNSVAAGAERRLRESGF